MQAILQHLFQKKSLAEVPLSALQQLTESYPFFAPGQFLLAEKLKETDPAAFEKQLQKTAVYFHNPLWLEHLLTTEQVETNDDTELLKGQFIAAPPVYAEEPVEKTRFADPEVQPSGEVTELPDNRNLKSSFTAYNLKLAPEDSNVVDEDDLLPDQTDFVQPGSEGTQPLLKDILQHSPETDTIEYQAYHTIDYFASQGIQLPLDEGSGDKLDKQLKSFTDWLKTMRRLPQAGKMQQMGHVNEEAITQQASTSLEEKEIITETMAEVLVKQQNIDKAILTYYKLGLLYPSKKAYFAAKIQALKQ